MAGGLTTATIREQVLIAAGASTVHHDRHPQTPESDANRCHHIETHPIIGIDCGDLVHTATHGLGDADEIRGTELITARSDRRPDEGLQALRSVRPICDHRIDRSIEHPGDDSAPSGVDRADAARLVPYCDRGAIADPDADHGIGQRGRDDIAGGTEASSRLNDVQCIDPMGFGQQRPGQIDQSAASLLYDMVGSRLEVEVTVVTTRYRHADLPRRRRPGPDRSAQRVGAVLSGHSPQERRDVELIIIVVDSRQGIFLVVAEQLGDPSRRPGVGR